MEQILSKEISKSKLLLLFFNNKLVKKYAIIAPNNPKKYHPKKIAIHLKYLKSKRPTIKSNYELINEGEI
tara:strand:- start:22266 stop:22475 length:210 start_codon:yes stop_codon:yes gene_type:complete